MVISDYDFGRLPAQLPIEKSPWLEAGAPEARWVACLPLTRRDIVFMSFGVYVGMVFTSEDLDVLPHMNSDTILCAGLR